MIILYPAYSFQSLASDLTEIEASEILSAYTAMFHPAIFQRFGKIPQWESASGVSADCSAELIVVPPCCESFLSSEFENIESGNNVTIIRNLKSRNEIANEIIKRFEIKHNFPNEFITKFYTLGTTALFVNLLAHHLHYMDSTNDTSIVQAFHDIINSINVNTNINNDNNNDLPESDTNKNTDIIVTKIQNDDNTDNTDSDLPKSESVTGESVTGESVTHNLFRDAFERICETKECYYPVSSYLLDLILVVKSTLGEPFRRLLSQRDSVNIFMPSLLLDSLPEIDPSTFEILKTASDSGKVEFAVDDVSEIPLLLFPLLDAADKILQGVSIYRERLGILPSIYGRQRAGLAPFLPQLLKLSGFKGVLYFAPLDGWHLKQRNQSKMIWQGIDGTKIDALIRYPVKCATNKQFFDFADNYSDLLNSDSVPTAVFASFPAEKINKTKNETAADSGTNNYRNENSDKENHNDNYCNENLFEDELDEPDWYDDLRRISSYTTQLGEFSKLESYFAATSQTGSDESISVENYITGEPCDIPFWLKIYRDNLVRQVVSAFGTVSQLLNQKPSDKSSSAVVRDSVSAFISAAGFSRADCACEKKQHGRRGVAILNAWNFGRRVFIDVSDWAGLPAAVSPIIFAGEAAGKKEIVVEVPPLGYVMIPEPEIPHNFSRDNSSLGSIESSQKNQKNQRNQKKQVYTKNQNQNQNVDKPEFPKSRWNIFSGLFSKKPKLQLILESEDKKAFFLRNEFFVARIDSDTGMLRSLFTGNYRYNRLSQQLGFRLPKALREVDSRSPKDPNRGYASSIVDEIFIDELRVVTGRIKICGRLICDDGCEVAKFTETITIRKFSRILEFNFAIEPLIEPSGDSAWDSYYAIRSAWNDNSLEFRGCLGDGVYSVTTNRVLSPRFIDLRTERLAITFFTEGLPFHRRFGERYLDTILIAKGDNKYDAEGNKIDSNKVDNVEVSRVVRKFRFGVGIDIRHPPASSFEFMLMKDELVVPIEGCDKLVSRWFFRSEAANVVAMYWDPIFDNAVSTNISDVAKSNKADNDNTDDADKNEIEPIGFKVYLLETEGTQTNSVLRSYQPVSRSYATNLLNEELQQMNINEAGVQFTLRPYELLPLVCIFRYD
ncbi:MAG: hypothetical protein LBT09_01510 [Planctomycetaceae bacterium]|jgi:hypothetical protein|nr:hypothetical protein [Planctomycetaceae bacterium]